MVALPHPQLQPSHLQRAELGRGEGQVCHAHVAHVKRLVDVNGGQQWGGARRGVVRVQHVPVVPAALHRRARRKRAETLKAGRLWSWCREGHAGEELGRRTCEVPAPPTTPPTHLLRAQSPQGRCAAYEHCAPRENEQRHSGAGIALAGQHSCIDWETWGRGAVCARRSCQAWGRDCRELNNTGVDCFAPSLLRT